MGNQGRSRGSASDTSRIRFGMVGLILLALLVAACGSDSGGGSDQAGDRNTMPTVSAGDTEENSDTAGSEEIESSQDKDNAVVAGDDAEEGMPPTDAQDFSPPTDGPVAKGVIAEGDMALVQSLLHVSGKGSTSPNGAIVAWEWAIEQPLGSKSVPQPSADHPEIVFEANVVGTYSFSLRVTDAAGLQSPWTMVGSVSVFGEGAIHIEVLWDTPGDPDQFDEGPEAGTDLDLHFIHPFAEGPDIDKNGAPDGWFDTPFDCFWFNPAPQWGSFDPVVADDPSLDRDDTDGAGPENLNLAIPEPDTTYRIGVHYWHDHGFGPSYVTVRIYVYGDLVYEVSGQKLHHHELWEVAIINPELDVIAIVTPNGKPKITPNYENPLFYQP